VHFGATFSTPAFSTPAIWCHCHVFHPCHLVPSFPLLRFQLPRFQRPRTVFRSTNDTVSKFWTICAQTFGSKLSCSQLDYRTAEVELLCTEQNKMERDRTSVRLKRAWSPMLLLLLMMMMMIDKWTILHTICTCSGKQLCSKVYVMSA